MNDKDITKLAAKLTQSLATKDDIKGVNDNINRVERKFDGKFEELNQKFDRLLESTDEVTNDHEKRLKKLERIPVIPIN